MLKNTHIFFIVSTFIVESLSEVRGTMRLITRPDLDGITCAVLLSQVERIEIILFSEPRMFNSGEINVTGDDIIANLPWHPDCFLWFDHHATNDPEGRPYRGLFRLAPSAARVIYEYYGNPSLDRYQELLQATDRIDSGHLDMEDVIKPQGYAQIAQTISTNTRDPAEIRFNCKLVTWLSTHPLERVLQLSELKRRIAQLEKRRVRYREEVRRRSRREENVIIVDLREAATFFKRDRFYVYTLFPEGNISITLYPDEYNPGQTLIAVGHSIFNRTSGVHVGHLMRRYGGGGHRNAGTCAVKNDSFDDTFRKILDYLIHHP
jgi:hypothetical protein